MRVWRPHVIIVEYAEINITDIVCTEKVCVCVCVNYKNVNDKIVP